MNHDEAVEYVENIAIQMHGKPLLEMNEVEKDSVDVVMKKHPSDVYLIGKIEAFDNNPPNVYFYVESDFGQSDIIPNYKRALKYYGKKIIETQEKEEE